MDGCEALEACFTLSWLPLCRLLLLVFSFTVCVMMRRSMIKWTGEDWRGRSSITSTTTTTTISSMHHSDSPQGLVQAQALSHFFITLRCFLDWMSDSIISRVILSSLRTVTIKKKQRRRGCRKALTRAFGSCRAERFSGGRGGRRRRIFLGLAVRMSQEMI